MKQDLNDIEKLFRENLENYESEVDPEVWNNIQSRLKQQPQSGQQTKGKGNLAEGAAKGGGLFSSTASVISGIVIAAAVITGSIYLITKDDGTKEQPVAKEQSSAPETTPSIENKEEKTGKNSEATQSTPGTQSSGNSSSVSPNEKEMEQPSNTQQKGDHPLIKKPFGEVSTPSDDRYNSENNHASSGSPTDIEHPMESNKDEEYDKSDEKKGTAEVDENRKALIPKASFSYEIVEKGPQPLVEFTNSSNTEKVIWQFGDGTQSKETGHHITHTYEKAGKYKVSLTAINDEGESHVVTQELEIYNSSLSMRKSFSPNGDGINDLFKVGKYNNIEEFRGTIYDMSGNEIFQWSDIERGWDGTNKLGENMPQGNYLCIVKATGKDGQLITKKTYFNLYR